ncbi:GH25 family lysozyme [Sinorhizobium medicae]|uniref:Glycoside hydrolase family 25 n=1 Tax=Sinorhizobium medicae (strain WSM419) TaxID=366394 RepID=A6UMP7_SINMW|nr:GH25 family lysozyme [Sinorhizobium medicae]ABR64927.1 glycoside hydrolase family 25 [Sinorhizobium medicae WSM419]
MNIKSDAVFRFCFLIAFMIACQSSAQEDTQETAAQPSQSVCQEIVAPAEFEMASTTIRGLNPGNDGIKPHGFVRPSAEQPVIHGIDVSKYQDEADFSSVRDCGGRFAYVRLSGGTDPNNELLYRTHWANARASGLVPGPYHNFSVVPQLLKAVAETAVPKRPQLLESIASQANESAARQADLFAERLTEVLQLDPEADRDFLPIAVDLTARPLADDVGGHLAVKDLYGNMVCEFIRSISKTKFATSPLVIFSENDTLTHYGLVEKIEQCSRQKVLYWIRFRVSNGTPFFENNKDGMFDNICSPREGEINSKFGRCLIEQYTSYGGFAIFKDGSPLDLDRIFATETEFRQLLQKG